MLAQIDGKFIDDERGYFGPAIFDTIGYGFVSLDFTYQVKVIR